MREGDQDRAAWHEDVSAGATEGEERASHPERPNSRGYPLPCPSNASDWRRHQRLLLATFQTSLPVIKR